MSPFRAEIATQLRLAGPVVLAQLGMMAMGTVDTLMVGHIPGERAAELALAAVGIGNVLFFAVGSFAIGVLMALDPVVSQALGAGDRRAVSLGVQRGLLLAAVLSALVALPLAFTEPLLRALGQPPEVVPLAADYLAAVAPSVPLFLGFALLRQVLQAMGHLRPMLLAVGVANLANVFFNWALIYGRAGLPELGAVGSGWATSLSRVVMIGLLLWFSFERLRPHLRPWSPQVFSLAPLWRMVRLGVPIGLQVSLEFWAFGLVAVLMGRLGSLEQAAHQVAINLASLSFMVPMGVSAAASVRVGFNVGRGDGAAVRRSAAVSLLLGVGAMAGSALLFLVWPTPLAALYSEDGAVVALAASLLPLAAAFQLFDGTQVVALGCLRGAGDTLVPMAINLFGYWVVGLPVGLWLTFPRELGPYGLWWGLVVGLAVVATVLALRLRFRLAGELERLHIDAPHADPLQLDPPRLDPPHCDSPQRETQRSPSQDPRVSG
jgi:MATE family multidrug resistance protein